MATIRYCDFATGNDSTGNGSYTTPYKTIDKCSAVSAAGDEIRVAASPASTAISVNLTWTFNSKAVTGTGDITAETPAKSFVHKGSSCSPGAVETAWEVASVAYSAGTGLTTITLVAKYSGTTEAVPSAKLGVTDTGTAAAAGTQIQKTTVAGTVAAPITISGGWILATQERTGNTWFFQSGTNKYGYGLYSNIGFNSMSDIGFLRYYFGVYIISPSFGWIVSTCTALGSNQSGFGTFGKSQIFNTVVGSGNTYGMSTSGAHGTIFKNSRFDSNYSGTFPFGTQNFSMHNCVTKLNTTYGHYCDGCPNISISNCNSTYSPDGIILTNCPNSVLNNYTFSNNTRDVTIVAAATYLQQAIAGCQQYGGTLGTNKAIYEYGVAQRNTAQARSGDCVEFIPSSASFPIVSYGPNDDWFVCSPSSTADLTAQLYICKSAGFNGTCELEAYVNGALVTGPTTLTLTESYAAYTILVPTASIPEAMPIVSIRVKVKGTAGSVYVDDFSWSQ